MHTADQGPNAGLAAMPAQLSGYLRWDSTQILNRNPYLLFFFLSLAVGYPRVAEWGRVCN